MEMLLGAIAFLLMNVPFVALGWFGHMAYRAAKDADDCEQL
jgi:hypothetical protein